MGDIVGRLFREFAVTLSVTILVSAVVSLTLTPMMCARLLTHQRENEQKRFYQASERVFQRVIGFYDRTLSWVLKHQTATLWVAVATLASTVLLYLAIPKGFFPVQDTGVVLGISEAPQSVSFQAMAERQQALARVILQDPAVASLSSFIGIDGTNTTLNSGRIQINLKPLEERRTSATEVIRRLQPEVAKVDGIQLFLQPVQDLTVEDRVSRTQYQYSLESADGQALADWVPRFLNRLQDIPELRDVASDLQESGLRATLTLDRATASRLGITPQVLDDALYDAFGQRQISTMFTQLNQYHVVLESRPGMVQRPEDLQNIFVRSGSGGAVPLSAFTRLEIDHAPLAVNHQGQFPVTTVSFNLAPGVSLGQAVKAIQQAEAESDMPPSIRGAFQGTAQAFGQSLKNTPFLILAAVVTVYILLGVLYESYIHPITILSTLPSAGVGALLSLMLCRTDFSVIALIGIILLIGIVEKNAIMMIDFALEAERKERQARRGGHLPGLPAALSPHRDDHLRRPPGRGTAGPGHGRRRRAAAAPGHRHRGRAHLQPGADPLHHPGDLPGLRPPVQAPSPPPLRPGRAPPGSRDAMISAPFIRRPVATTLLMVALALAGMIARQFLPVSPLPQVEFPTIQVEARLPGASPETMASSVATPLERQFGRIAGITEMTSGSSLGSTNITLQFDLDRNIDAAARDVQAAINAARGNLPSNLPNNPSYHKVNPSDAPVLLLALTSKIVPRAEMYDIASSVLQQKIAQVPGVGQVDVWGGSLPAVRVNVNPAALNGRGLGLEDVRIAIARANIDRPKGDISDRTTTWSIAANDQMTRAQDYNDLILTFKNGAALRLGDVATVTDSVENIFNSGLTNGTPAIMVAITKQPDANVIETVNRVRAILPELKTALPPTIELQTVLDSTETIRASVRDVQTAMMISIGLVILVVFLFLRSVRSTLIPSVVVPVSLIGTFGVMYLLGYTIDNLSLMALTVATGFVVDDAIVVVENITRHLEQGMKPMQAALTGAEEIGSTVVSISISLVAVFIPILLMGGVVGRLFREFAVTLSVAIALSMLLSLTATPMMCSRLLLAKDQEKHGRMFQASERFFKRIMGAYEASLAWVLKRKFLIAMTWIATVATTVALYWFIPKGFFPQQDTGRLNGTIQGEQDVSFKTMERLMNQYVAIVQDGSRCPERHGVHRQQQQRPHEHLPEAEGRAQGHGRPGDRADPQAHRPASRARRCTCSPSRTSAWGAASGGHSSSTPSRGTTRTSSSPGRRRSCRSCGACPS